MERKPKITADVQRLMDMEDEVVTAKDLAPIVKIHPQTIIEYAKTGKWDLCRFVISGDRVKFFRKDFLQQCGFMDPEPEETVETTVATAVIDGLKAMLEAQKETIRLLETQNKMLMAMMDFRQKLTLSMMDEINPCVLKEDAANE